MPHLRHALRRLAQKPAFTVLAILTLAIGLGANAAIFAIVDAVLLEPLPFPNAERLVAIEHAAPGLDLPQLNMSGRLYVHYRQNARSFTDIGLYDDGPAAISGLERPVQVAGASVTPSVFPILGVKPARGRGFTEDEGRPGGPATVVVSDGFWRRHLGADPDVLERRLTVDGVTRQVVGVMETGFDFPSPEVEVWVPEVVDPETETLGSFGRAGIARLADGVDPERATTDLTRFAGDLEGTFPDESAALVLARSDFSVVVRPLRDAVVGDAGPLLWVLLATVGFVLLIAALNVANLFLARAEERRRETAIRTALGAGRGTLAVTSLGEGLALAALGAVAGLGLGKAGLALLLDLAPGRLPRLHEVAIDPRTTAVVAALALLSGVVFGLIPILRLRLRHLALHLKDGGRSAALGRERHRARRVLVTAQMAIAVLLLVGAGLLARSYQRLVEVDPGFDPGGAISFRLTLPDSKAEHDADAARFYDRLLERLAALPGVEAVGSSTILPLTGRNSGSGHRLKDEVDRGEGKMPTVFTTQQVSPGYFEAVGVPILEGRPLGRADFENRTGAVVVGETLARRRWPGESALGKRLFPGMPEDEAGWFEVVGVAADVHVENLTEEPPETVYYPWLGTIEDLWVPRHQSVVVRAAGDPRALMGAVREAVWSLDPDLPLAEVETLDELVEDARARFAFTALMLVIAAGVAVGLGAVGTYGVVSYLVAQRTGEIGVRMALGAPRSAVLGMILREGLVLAGIGGGVGLVAAAALSRFLDAILYAVSPYDPLTFAAVPFVLLAFAVTACLVPARRAAAVDPMVALRHE